MKKDEIHIRPATSDDIEIFFDDKLPVTVRGWVAEYFGEPACFVGIYYQNNVAIAFSELREMDIPKKAIFRGAKMLMEKVKSLGIPVQAEAESGKFLKKMGFTQNNKEGTMFIWLN